MDKQQLETIVVKTPDEIRERPTPLRISSRHIHLCTEDYGRLLPNRPISEKEGLLQPGQHAAEQTVTLVGPKGQLKDVRLLDPLRDTSQVEISRTDTRTLGIAVPLRMSDSIQGIFGVRLVSPFAELDLVSGVTAAQRYIHMSPLNALILRISHGDRVSVTINGDERWLIFDNVVVHASPDMHLGMHIDIDETNATDADNPQALTILVTSQWTANYCNALSKRLFPD